MKEKKRIMSTLEYSVVVSELQDLVGKRFEKFYTLSDGKYRLRIGKADIIIELGIRFHTTSYLEEGTELDEFSKRLRKELDGSFLRNISQVNNDRIIRMEFDNASLFFEMFAKGNVILVRDGKTVACIHRESWSDRETSPKRPYTPPKSSFVASVSDALSQKYIAASLMKLPLGKPYVLELLRRAGIDEKTPGSSLSPDQVASIQEKYDEMGKSSDPQVFFENGLPVDFGLTKFSLYSESRSFKSFNAALDFFYQNASFDSGPSEEVLKIKRRLEEQEQRLVDIKNEEHVIKSKGDFIYENYDKIEKAIREANESGLDGFSKKHANVKINKKEKTIELDI